MKKLLIVNNNMHLGGVQKALVNLLGCIHDRCEVTLALFHPEGELMAAIPKDVKVIPVTSGYRYLGMPSADARGGQKLLRSFFAAVTRLLGRNAAISLMALGQHRLRGYDLAISYLHDAGDKMFYGGCNDFVLRHVEAKTKVTCLHCDFSLVGGNTPGNQKRYAAFDGILACSDGCKERFLSCMPRLRDRVTTLYNCHDFESIRSQAEEAAVSLPKERVNIVTVARLGREKGVPRAIEALAQLKNANYHYYIVGDGIQRPLVEAAIAKYGLQDRVTLVGEMKNPYGYVKAADLLLIPSVSEAAPMVIGEAACLGTPVLTTETSSAREMVEATGYGWVVENSIEGIAQGLERFLQNPQKPAFPPPDNEKALEQLAAIIG